MPLSRQTSRIVWPSRPSTTRPSTSMPDARRGLRPLRRLGRESRSASDSSSGRRRCPARDASSGRASSMRGALGGRRDRVVGQSARWPRLARHRGWAGRRRPGRSCGGDARRARTGSIASRSAAGASPAARGRTARRPTTSARGPSSSATSPARGVPVAMRSPISAMPAQPDPARDRLAARLVGAEAGQEAGEVDDAGPVVRDDHRAGADVRARGAQGVERRRACRARSAAGCRPSARRRATALRERPLRAACRRAPTTSRERRARAGPRRCRSRCRPADVDEDRSPGRRRCRSRANAFAPLRRIQGTAARVCTFWTTVGALESRAVAGCGGRCSGWPRLPSSALRRTVSSPSMYAPWTGRTSISMRAAAAERVVAERSRASSPRRSAASSRVDGLGRSARTEMIRLARADGERGDRQRPRSTAYGSVSRSVRSVLRGRVRAVAVRDDVALRRRRLGRGAPLVGGRVAGAAAAAQAASPRPRDGAGGAEIADRAPRGRRTRPPRTRVVEVGRVRRRRRAARRIAASPRASCRTGHRGPRRRRRPACRRGTAPARRGSASSDGRRRAATAVACSVADGRLEPQVAVVRGGAVDRGVPRAGPLADVLQRRDRQEAERGLGRLEDRRASASGRGRSRSRISSTAPGRTARSARTPGPGRAGRTGAAPIPRAARRTSRAGPSARGSGPSCPCRPCRCTRSGRPGRTGSTSRT